jgi:lipopolysaccharide/colanic/teichoic acid biosynthesis glycosyltransferase
MTIYTLARKRKQSNLLEAAHWMNGEIIRKSELLADQKPKSNLAQPIEIIRQSNYSVLQYIQEQLSFNKINKLLLSSDLRVHDHSANNQHISNLMVEEKVRAILDFKLVNHHTPINKYFTAINSLLPDAGIYITCFESHRQLNRRKYGENPDYFSKTKILLSYLIHRVIPSFALFRKAYLRFTKAGYHYVSTPEVLGRLVFCGFEIIDFKMICGLTYCVAMKTQDSENIDERCYGPIIRLNRVGRYGRMIGVFKVRTMHPYSEYLQDYLLKLNGYSCKGKPANDFRITCCGKFLRKYWLDELPQLINVAKGEMKIVGVRPVSLTKFKELPIKLRIRRVKEKPGCIPPYVSLNTPSPTGNIEAEKKYLEELDKSKLTDLKYFFKALYNIVFFKIISE